MDQRLFKRLPSPIPHIDPKRVASHQDHAGTVRVAGQAHQDYGQTIFPNFNQHNNVQINANITGNNNHLMSVLAEVQQKQAELDKRLSDVQAQWNSNFASAIQGVVKAVQECNTRLDTLEYERVQSDQESEQQNSSGQSTPKPTLPHGTSQSSAYSPSSVFSNMMSQENQQTPAPNTSNPVNGIPGNPLTIFTPAGYWVFMNPTSQGQQFTSTTAPTGHGNGAGHGNGSSVVQTGETGTKPNNEAQQEEQQK